MNDIFLFSLSIPDLQWIRMWRNCWESLEKISKFYKWVLLWSPYIAVNTFRSFSCLKAQFPWNCEHSIKHYKCHPLGSASDRLLLRERSRHCCYILCHFLHSCYHFCVTQHCKNCKEKRKGSKMHGNCMQLSKKLFPMRKIYSNFSKTNTFLISWREGKKKQPTHLKNPSL